MGVGVRPAAGATSCSSAARHQLPTPQRRPPPTARCLPPSADEACSASQQQPFSWPRRSLLAATALALGGVALPWPAAASKLPAAVDRAWEGLGGGPADLVFPGGLEHRALCVGQPAASHLCPCCAPLMHMNPASATQPLPLYTSTSAPLLCRPVPGGVGCGERASAGRPAAWARACARHAGGRLLVD